MLKQPTLCLVAIALVGSSTIGSGNNFGETFGATCLGTAVGSTVGTALGNAISRPRERGVTVVREVAVPVRPIPSRLRKLERRERRLSEDLAALAGKKNAIECRIQELEHELSAIEAAIDSTRQTLAKVRNKKLAYTQV